MSEKEMLKRLCALEQRVRLLEEESVTVIERLDTLILEDAEEEFMGERQQWIDSCREQAAEKRRTS